MIVITNPLAGVVFQPMLQLQGYSPEPLASVRYDITNGSGSLTNMEGYVVKQFVDTNTFEITTNWFACVDLNLAAGTNTVTLKATDRAGNVTTTNLNYVFVYPTNAPVLSLVWPQDGDLLSGTSFTVRGRLSDPTAQVTAEAVGNGVTHSMTGIVERDGKFWIENVPLAAGANEVTISVMDAGTNSTGTNFTVVKSGVELTIDPLNSSELNNPYITVYGSINVSTHKIWVNGMEVTNVSSGSWYVEGVPLNVDGTAVVEARAIPLTDNGGNGTGGGGGQNSTFDDPGNPDSPSGTTIPTDEDKDPEVVMIHYEKNRSYLSLTRDEYPTKKQTEEIIKWDVKQPGSWFDDYCGGNTFGSHMYYVCRSRNWESNGIGTLKSWEDRGGEEVCGVQLYGAPTPYTMAETWPGESCQVTGYRVPAGGGADQVVARTARTLYELHTGGKKLSGRKNLFVLSGGAEGVGNPFWPEDDNDKRSYVISNTSVVLGDVGRLDNEGRIYKALEDGVPHDVTPRVDGNPYYTFGGPGFGKISPRLSELTFSAVNLTHIFPVKQDDGPDYPAPHWKTNETTHTVQSSPALFVSGATVKAADIFLMDVKGSIPGVNLVAKGVATGGGATLKLLGTASYAGGSTWSVTTTAEQALPANKVDCFKPMHIDWQIAFEGSEEFANAGENTNHVYVSWSAPTTDNLFHTVVDVACRNAKGKTNESDIVAGIWGDFTNRSVLKWDGSGPLRYWGPNAVGHATTLELVKYLDGQCGSWRGFLMDVLSSHGIASVPHAVTPPNPFVGFSVYATIPGQGGNPVERHFLDHAVNSYGGDLYDPSYGSKHPSKLDWEDAAIESFGNPTTLDTKGLQQTVFTPPNLSP